MKNRKKYAQREEVRKILHAIRLELAAMRAVQEVPRVEPLRIDELFLCAKEVT